MGRKRKKRSFDDVVDAMLAAYPVAKAAEHVTQSASAPNLLVPGALFQTRNGGRALIVCPPSTWLRNGGMIGLVWNSPSRHEPGHDDWWGYAPSIRASDNAYAVCADGQSHGHDLVKFLRLVNVDWDATTPRLPTEGKIPMPKFDPAKVRDLFKDGESGGNDTKPALKIEVGKTYVCRNGNRPTITGAKRVKGRTVFVSAHLIMKDGQKYDCGDWHYHEDGKNAGVNGDYRDGVAVGDDIIEEIVAEGEEKKQWIPGKLKLEVGKKYRRLDGQVVTAIVIRNSGFMRATVGHGEGGSANTGEPASWSYTVDGAWASEAENPGYYRHLIECVEDTTPKPEDTVPEAKPAGKLDSALAALRDALGGGADPETVRRIVNEELDKRPARVITIEIPKIEITETVEHAHPKFPDLCALIANNQRVFIAGPAGSGKTTAVEEAAKLLKRPFFVQPPVADKFELLGFVDAAGNYQDTPMYHWATTENAILLLDEVDGSFPQPLLALNMALANGYAVFPKHGKVPIHSNNAVACTANTWGGGADFDYVGRAKLDAAFLNRFPAKLCWDYDEDFELELAKAQAAATKPLVKVIQRIRENARKHGIKIPVTPRDTLFYCRMRAAGWSHDKTLDCGVLSTCKEDQRAKLLEGVKAP